MDATLTSPAPASPPEPKDHRVPPATARFGMTLFLISLGMLFAASMVGFVLIRIISLQPTIDPATGEPIPSTAPALNKVDLPLTLWLSTAVILFSSVTIHAAVEAIRRERQFMFKFWLNSTLALGFLFLLIQTPSLLKLLGEHATLTQAENPTAIYGLIFTLIIIHALHVIGGILPLIYITIKAHQARYDHEYHTPVSGLATYWHFLDAVWLVMFATLLIAS